MRIAATTLCIITLAIAAPTTTMAASDRWNTTEQDFHLALRKASQAFNVSYSWLHNCSHSEGSDRMVWNRQGSGAFGPMQFMRSTFYRMASAAWNTLGRNAPPKHYLRWNSNIGQAYAAAWGFSHGRSHEWTGRGC